MSRLQACKTGCTEEHQLMGKAATENIASLQKLWAESYQEELAGEITRALEIHELILSRIGVSYAGCLRAGWLHYRAGGYSRSLHFYVKALLLSPGESAPLTGMRNCHLAMGNKEAAARAAKAIRATEELNHSQDHQIAV